MNRLSRDQVFGLINQERTYQDAQAEQWDHKGVPTVEAELLMFEHYIQQARNSWVSSPGNSQALDVIRKIAGISVRVLENHGAEAGPNGPIRPNGPIMMLEK